MSNFVALRIKKLKQSDLVLAKNHNQRLIENDKLIFDKSKSKDNICLVGDDNIDALVDNRIKKLNVKTIKSGKNESVVAVEMVISATPTFFRDDPLAYGEYDKDKTLQWANRNIEFLKEKHGDNFIRADLHLDEATPHLHVIITPIAQKEVSKRRTKQQIKDNMPAQKYTSNVLDAKHMFDRDALIQLQTDAAEAVKDLGLNRGVHGSRAKHTTVAKFMDKIREILTTSPDFKKIKTDQLVIKPHKNKEITAKQHRINESDRIKDIFKKSIIEIYQDLKHYKKQALLYKSKYEHEKERTNIVIKIQNGNENIGDLLERNISKISEMEESLFTLANEKNFADQRILDLEESRKTHMRRASTANDQILVQNSIIKALESSLEGAKMATDRAEIRAVALEREKIELQQKVDFKFRVRPVDRKGPQFDRKGNRVSDDSPSL